MTNKERIKELTLAIDDCVKWLDCVIESKTKYISIGAKSQKDTFERLVGANPAHDCDHEKDSLGMCKYCRKQLVNPEQDQ